LHIAYQTYFTHTDPDQNVPTSTSSSWRRSARQVWLDLVGVSRQREYTDLVGLNAVVPGNVLDIGCGNGMRLARLRALGWNVVGQEVDPHAASIAINSLGIPVFVGLLHEAGFADDCFDAVISNHVLEHVLDPAAFLAETYRVLKPGGLLVAVTPNARSLGHRVFGRYWMGLDPPRHIRICSPTSLSRLASNAAIDAPKVWTTAANAEAFAKTGLLIRHNSKIGARGYSPSGVGRLVGAMVFATAAQFYHRVRPDSGEECVLWAQKPPV
jgi:SAM-dependent methyltransferase